jgi:formylmethanofuran dehydrogenase subunit E
MIMATEKNDPSPELINKFIDSHVTDSRLQSFFHQSIAFHTFPAPGLLIGVFMVDHALELLNATAEEKLYGVSETNKCAPDPLQIITHCTTGNSRLRIIPIGKFAITLNRPSEGPSVEGVRVYVDSEKLLNYPTINLWFTNDPRFNRSMISSLIEEIFRAGRKILSHERVLVKVQQKQKWRSAICPSCGERVPDDLLQGGVCAGCGPTRYYEEIQG